MGNVARLSIDRGIPSDLNAVPARAREIEQQGYDGCWTGEINHAPFLPLLLAAEHTSRLQLGTSIAVAFALSAAMVTVRCLPSEFFENRPRKQEKAQARR